MLIILCGIPGSGKTTLSRQLVKKCNAKLYSFDALPNAHHPKYADIIRSKMWLDIAEDARNGHTIICDDLHTKLKWRTGLLTAVANIPCKKVLVIMGTSLEECLQRNVNRKNRLPDFVVENIYKKYEPPSYDEGWDEILYY